MALTPQESAYIRQLAAQVQALQSRPMGGGGGDSDAAEIDAEPGRRVNYTLSGDLTFTIANLGLRSSPISMLVNQDGPFVMTHYPAFAWYANAPSTATASGKWRPVASYPLPAQQNGLGAVNAESTGYDIIDIAYELVDGGSQRGFQNLVVGPHLMSTRESFIKLPRPTRFAPNTTIQVYVTLNDIFFGGGAAVPTTGGILHVDIPGYRIVNLGA